jgi:hypothetical protein
MIPSPTVGSSARYSVGGSRNYRQTFVFTVAGFTERYEVVEVVGGFVVGVTVIVYELSERCDVMDV